MATYIAREAAFHGGRLVAKGSEVEFGDGDVPAWAVKDESQVHPDPVVRGDVRPADTIAAVKQKAEGISNHGQIEPEKRKPGRPAKTAG